MNIFQQIFTDHYEYVQYVIKPRPIVMDNIDKMIHCGDSSFDGALYACEKCGKFKFLMSDNDLLDMDYFLHEDEDDIFNSVRGFFF